MKSSFSGVIQELDFISVDNFEDTTKSAYFLSHYHSDHFVGLDNSLLPRALNENNAYIYASEVTIAIIEYEQNYYLRPYLRSLQLGRNTIIVHKDGEEIYLNVVVLPAGHSLGSVMFLFENEQTILYTGDFRITANDIKKYTHLHDRNGEPKKIDALYVDTTFQNVSSFPRRSEVIQNIVDKVKHWLDLDKENRVFISTSANYGYESICNAIYNEIGVKSYLGAKKWNIFRQFPKQMVGITDDSNSRVALDYKTKFLDYQSDTKKTLTIHLSAIRWQYNKDNRDEEFMLEERPNSIIVCFATHCGRDELIGFVNHLQPAKVIGFPDPLVRNSPVKLEPPIGRLKFKNSKRSKPFETGGDSVARKRLSKDAVKALFDW